MRRDARRVEDIPFNIFYIKHSANSEVKRVRRAGIRRAALYPS